MSIRFSAFTIAVRLLKIELALLFKILLREENSLHLALLLATLRQTSYRRTLLLLRTKARARFVTKLVSPS